MLANELLELLDQLGTQTSFPAVRQIFIPHLEKNTGHILPEKYAKFGLLRLEDDSCGFFYTRLGDTLENLWNQSSVLDELVGMPVTELARFYADPAADKKSLGMAAINAASAHFFSSQRFFERFNGAFPRLDKKPRHLGMVGFFPPLVKKFRAGGQKLTVIEQQAAFVEKGDNFEVTLDATRLADCDQVLCTASTLLNDSLPAILAHCADDCFISLIGPTAGCLPDPLFALGIDEIGASRVVAIDTLIERMQNAEPWGDAVEKYTISAAAYPGWRALLT